MVSLHVVKLLQQNHIQLPIDTLDWSA